jgi:uncharacterized protein (DUF1330 family)
MSAYAIAHLLPGPAHPDVFEYLEKIQGTLDPFGGHFLVHGGTTHVLEGTWPGATVVLQFPGMDDARAWYASPAYRKILPLRTDHLTGDVILVEGVEPGHDSAGMGEAMRRAAEAGT